jgi:hypothetical protein
MCIIPMFIINMVADQRVMSTAVSVEYSDLIIIPESNYPWTTEFRVYSALEGRAGISDDL